MRPVTIRLVLMLAAAVAVASAIVACGDSDSDSASGGDAETAVRDLFDRQLALLRAGDFDALYANFSPGFREQCSQEQLVGSIMAAGLDAGRLEFEDVQVVVDGDRAAVTYTTIYGGDRADEVGPDEPDVFIRSGDRWYDELDAHTHC